MLKTAVLHNIFVEIHFMFQDLFEIQIFFDIINLFTVTFHKFVLAELNYYKSFKAFE